MDGLASNIVARFLPFWFYVTSVDTDKTAAQSMSAVFSTYSYITVYYTVALTKAKNFFEDRAPLRRLNITVASYQNSIKGWQ